MPECLEKRMKRGKLKKKKSKMVQIIVWFCKRSSFLNHFGGGFFGENKYLIKFRLGFFKENILLQLIYIFY